MNLINIAHAGVITNAVPISNVLMNVFNFLLQVVGIIAIISLVLAGIMYLAVAGDEKKMQFAKRSAQASIIGIILALGGMILVKMMGRFFS